MENRVLVPFDDAVRAIARESAREVLKEHMTQCPGPKQGQRIDALEAQAQRARGFLAGAGAVGGIVGAVVGWLLTRLLRG